VVTIGFSSHMYTVVESDGYVEVCVQISSGSGTLVSGAFAAFSVSVETSTAGERVFNT